MDIILAAQLVLDVMVDVLLASHHAIAVKHVIALLQVLDVKVARLDAVAAMCILVILAHVPSVIHALDAKHVMELARYAMGVVDAMANVFLMIKLII